jgi:hypothetical protein
VTGDAEREGITLDGENAPFQWRNAYAGKCLERMHRANGRTESAQRFENTGIKRTTSVQNDLSLPIFVEEPRHVFRDVRDGGIWRGNENIFRREGLPRDSGEGMTLPNESNGPARARFGACDDAKDLPACLA